jgi:hypothetical protein
MSNVWVTLLHREFGFMGEDFEVLSDPFPEAGGIAVRVKTTKDAKVRVLGLPATVLQRIRAKARNAA